ncbi:acetyl-CoA C-acyltransferase [Zoogloea sp.]|jgi:acetyl-CoA C-acetyltransferase|uniref:acetyl-CoA C-acyltransferase n=1 Tax=Zoogloea sp. TaxID=49181 RepID=UPI002BE39BB1|nr:acetyl-CoA C-acyltransferase [Zoogloea sp.]HOY02879.1 acetyl-CoA C-acyltransferase [Zoogloea sp.]HPI61970.1 acetyl-CoA C-acyltransferase [Zoogloea sp.]
MPDSIVIVAARRTPIGAFQGCLTPLSAPQLASAAIRGAFSGLGELGRDVDEAVFGCCLMAGVKQAPARQAVIGAGLPDSVPATTLTKMCGSGMKATMLVHDMLLAGSCNVGLAGGMESMSNAPYVLTRARGGYRLGHGQAFDHMFLDGLEDAYEGKLMGYFADLAAAEFGIARERQDAYAAESVRRAQHAVASGAFREEIAPVAIPGRQGEKVISDDETPGTCDIAKIPKLKPAFTKDGSITPANASSISDGAAALVMMRESEALRRGITPLARILSHATHAQQPGRFPTAPAPAIRRALERAGWGVGDVDLFEINEAFAVVTLLAMDELGLPAEVVNVNGGACAMGHPVGATGARILVTLIHALRARGLRRGLASLCIGGGEATAMAIEVL